MCVEAAGESPSGGGRQSKGQQQKFGSLVPAIAAGKEAARVSWTSFEGGEEDDGRHGSMHEQEQIGDAEANAKFSMVTTTLRTTSCGQQPCLDEPVEDPVTDQAVECLASENAPGILQQQC